MTGQTEVLNEEDGWYVDGPVRCPRCDSPEYGHDEDCHAWICDGCGLYLEDEPSDDDY